MDPKNLYRKPLARIFQISLVAGIVILLIGVGMNYARLNSADRFGQQYTNCYVTKCSQLSLLKLAAGVSPGGVASWAAPIVISGYAVTANSLILLAALKITSRKKKY